MAKKKKAPGGLEKILFVQSDEHLSVRYGGTCLRFYKYKGEESIRVDLVGAPEFCLPNRAAIRNIVQIFQWYLKNNYRIPELIPLMSRKKERVLYAITPEEAKVRLKGGRVDMRGGRIPKLYFKRRAG